MRGAVTRGASQVAAGRMPCYIPRETPRGRGWRAKRIAQPLHGCLEGLPLVHRIRKRAHPFNCGVDGLHQFLAMPNAPFGVEELL